jgi:AraC-like DNA-binding protein
MQHVVLSTAGIPERERFAYWRQAVSDIGVPGERDRPSEPDFEGSLNATIGDCLARFRFRSSKYRVSRPYRDARRRVGEDRVWLYRQIGGGSRHEHRGSEFVTREGNLIIGDPALPSATEALVSYDTEIWHFPRQLLDPHLPAARHPRMLCLSNGDGLGGILLAYLEALSVQVETFGEPEAAMVADNFCRLIAVACGMAPAAHGEAVRVAKLEEVKRYIGTHLCDPELSPAKAAAAMKICVRRLHSLFEPTGTSFSEYVLHRRLEECHAALSGPAGANRSVTDIAFAWGFSSLPTFYRTFARAFGAPPSEIREGKGAIEEAGNGYFAHGLRHDCAPLEKTRKAIWHDHASWAEQAASQ